MSEAIAKSPRKHIWGLPVRGEYAWLGLAFVAVVIFQLGPTVTVDGWKIKGFEWRLWDWYVEDSAISFAYARNWFQGDGLVAFPGGERIEGYSNPLWVLMMTIAYFFGIDGFWSSKLFAIALSIGTVWIVWRLMKEIVDDRDSHIPVFAALLLALNPNYAFYNAAGLENPLFSFLLAGGAWRTLVEARRGSFPWASVWFLLLSVTRPEGIMYAAWGGFFWLLLSVLSGRGLRPVWTWLFTFFVPFLSYHAVRYQYFGWLFPNTYYAKIGEAVFRPFAWLSSGWKYVRNYGWDSGIGWFLPLFAAGVTGLRGRRAFVVLIAVIGLAVAFSYPTSSATDLLSWWPKDLPEPSRWPERRVWLMVGMLGLLVIGALRDARAAGRIMMLGFAVMSVFFALRAGGDWMKGFRWMSLASVPITVLLASGIDEVAAWLQRNFSHHAGGGWTTPGWLGATVLFGALMPGWVQHADFLFAKREIGPYSVRQRADYSDFVIKRLWVDDGEVWNLDVDMGAHMYWSSHHMLDIAGLIDIPVSRHKWSQDAFARDYVFHERRPMVAHLHGGWASKTRLLTYPEWDEGWVDLPGFPVNRRTYHVGNHVRRDLILAPHWTGSPGRRVSFTQGVTLEGVDIPASSVDADSGFYVVIGFSETPTSKEGELASNKPFRALLFLSSVTADASGTHALASYEIPIGYDWVDPDMWREGEVFVGRFAFPIAKDLPPGRYDVGVVLTGEDGQMLDVTGLLPEGAVLGDGDTQPARFARGEVRFAAMLDIGSSGTGHHAAQTYVDDAKAHAAQGRCEAADHAWRLARESLPLVPDRWVALSPADDLAKCWAHRAEHSEDLRLAATQIARARYWQHREPEVWRVGERVGEALDQRGDEAFKAKRWEEAWRDYSAALDANPSLSKSRRKAEEARDYRLRLVKVEHPSPATPAKKSRPPREPRAKPTPEVAPGQEAEVPPDPEAAEP